ncbi:uncharacterized protein LOC114575773 [Exaiptasia diaphana]|uniref:Uncharacterized protein n=1 Tax=Exaiptasia diaphana TaxID=2652724 RepID=A0A913YPW5_EXADI|nr:uncharacterized protein LOC114575773 [Exaiptasia diaphana]
MGCSSIRAVGRGRCWFSRTGGRGGCSSNRTVGRGRCWFSRIGGRDGCSSIRAVGRGGKRVQEKKIVKERRNEKVAIASIKDDTSINRQDSHNKLLAMVTKSTDIFETTYTKKEIELLFQAYGLKYCNSWTKTRLNPVLVDAIKAATQFICPELLLSHERKWHIDAFCGVVIVSIYTGICETIFIFVMFVDYFLTI